MSETWQRTEPLDDNTVLDTEVEITTTAAGMVEVSVDVIRRFLREAGYEQVDPC